MSTTSAQAAATGPLRPRPLRPRPAATKTAANQRRRDREHKQERERERVRTTQHGARSASAAPIARAGPPRGRPSRRRRRRFPATPRVASRRASTSGMVRLDRRDRRDGAHVGQPRSHRGAARQRRRGASVPTGASAATTPTTAMIAVTPRRHASGLATAPGDGRLVDRTGESRLVPAAGARRRWRARKRPRGRCSIRCWSEVKVRVCIGLRCRGGLGVVRDADRPRALRHSRTPPPRRDARRVLSSVVRGDGRTFELVRRARARLQRALTPKLQRPPGEAVRFL